MTTEQVSLTEQIEVVQRALKLIRNIETPFTARDKEALDAAAATLQQHERVMAALREIANMEGREGMTDYKFAELALGLTNGVLAALDDAASEAATPAGKGEHR